MSDDQPGLARVEISDSHFDLILHDAQCFLSFRVAGPNSYDARVQAVKDTLFILDLRRDRFDESKVRERLAARRTRLAGRLRAVHAITHARQFAVSLPEQRVVNVCVNIQRVRLILTDTQVKIFGLPAYEELFCSMLE